MNIRSGRGKSNSWDGRRRRVRGEPRLFVALGKVGSASQPLRVRVAQD